MGYFESIAINALDWWAYRFPFAFNGKRDFLVQEYSPMIWTDLKYSKAEIIEAGEVLLKEKHGEAYDHSLEVLSNWRAFHGFPLNTFQMRLRKAAVAVCSHPFVSQRLKRTTSILSIAGCRAIVDTIPQANRLFKAYNGGADAIHNGRHIEIQLRTKLQHAWATAVEVVETFTGQSLRRGETGDAQWKAFFKLVSSAFAMVEYSRLVPGTAVTEGLLQQRIREGMNVLAVREKLEGYSRAIRVIKGEKKMKRAKHFVLVLNPLERTLNVTGYSEREFNKASEEVHMIERNQPGVQAVLVGAQSIRAIPKAYPNYWLDTRLFLRSIDRFLALEPLPLPLFRVLGMADDELAWGEEPEDKELRKD